MNSLQPLGSTGLLSHRFGFGCYRVEDSPPHEAALRRYLARGGNLIDTSANYGDGDSEQVAGRVLEGVPRDRVIVVTKGGYIQGQNMALAEQRDFPETVRYGPGIWHCIHPAFLETQIERSCRRLRRDNIDVYLLHNPEYYLEDLAHRRELTPDDHEEFYRRIREAFRYLEQKVAEGVIGWYGISSNNFGKPAFPPGKPSTMTSVSRCLLEAEAVSGAHHFRVVQLPLNLYEPGGALAPNNEGHSVLEFCAAKGIGVLANRPLNAFQGNQLLRLADWGEPGSPPPGDERLRELLQPLTEHEEKFARIFGPPVSLASGETMHAAFLRIVPQMQSLDHWRHTAGDHIIGPVQAWLAATREQLGENAEWRPWVEEFVSRINPLIESVQNHIEARQQTVSDQIRDRLQRAGYPRTEESLSQMALRVLTGLDGLSCVLVGMRRNVYVEDVMLVADAEPLDSLTILRSFSSRNS